MRRRSGIQVNLAEMTYRGQPQAALGVAREVTLRYRVDLSDDGRSAQPVHHLVFVVRNGVRMRGNLCDHQVRGQAALHGLSGAEHVVGSRLGIAGRTKIVRLAVAAKAELQELRAIAVPLENHGLCPVMPHGSSDSYILTQDESAPHSSTFVRVVIVACDNREALRSVVAVNLTVALS